MTDPIADLWLALARVRKAIRPGESILERLAVDPWDHDDPAIQDAWVALTAPENLHSLERWAVGDLNPEARRATERAIVVARARRP